jgi:4'-phosphopantetheinyl transferase
MFSETLSRLVRLRSQGALHIELPQRALHLWLLPQTLVCDACDRLAYTLTDDEVQRASRYRRQQDRERFVARRSVLRALLGGYLRRDPASLRFTTGKGGKPMLSGRDAQTLCFSVSQTNGLAAIACGWDHAPGVDVERSVRRGERLCIGGDILSVIERENLGRTADSTDAKLLRIWTRKEALLKALGTGLSGTPNAWSVMDDGDSNEGYWRALYQGTEVSGWTLMDVDAGDTFLAALAIPCGGVRISVLDWGGSQAASPCRTVSRTVDR